MSRSSRDGLVILGHVAGAYGIKGWVKVVSHTEPPKGILAYSPWKIRSKGRDWVDARPVSGRLQGKTIVVQLEGCVDRDQAQGLKNAEIAVLSEQLEPLQDDEFYWHQLEGLRVVHGDDDALQVFGVVDHMMSTGANDVMVVKPSADSIDGRERLIPWLPERVVRSVDLNAGEIRVDWEPDY